MSHLIGDNVDDEQLGYGEMIMLLIGKSCLEHFNKDNMSVFPASGFIITEDG